MTGVSVVTLRRALAEAVVTQLGPLGWAESTFAPGVLADPRQHARFSLSAVSTVPLQGSSQRPPWTGAQVLTEFELQWLWALPADAQLDGYDAALTAEEGLAAAVIATPDYTVRLVAAARRVLSTSWVQGTLRLAVQHPLNLSLPEAPIP